MGLARPRRLSPLSPVDTPLQVNNKEEGGIWNYADVMPTPAGLHLSVNYTQNLGLGECGGIGMRRDRQIIGLFGRNRKEKDIRFNLCVVAVIHYIHFGQQTKTVYSVLYKLYCTLFLL